MLDLTDHLSDQMREIGLMMIFEFFTIRVRAWSKMILLIMAGLTLEVLMTLIRYLGNADITFLSLFFLTRVLL